MTILQILFFNDYTYYLEPSCKNKFTITSHYQDSKYDHTYGIICCYTYDENGINGYGINVGDGVLVVVDLESVFPETPPTPMTSLINITEENLNSIHTFLGYATHDSVEKFVNEVIYAYCPPNKVKTQAINPGLNPEVFRELAHKLSETQYADKELNWGMYDSPHTIIKKNSDTKYYDFFCEMFEPQKGERNYWWGSSNVIWNGWAHRDNLKNHIQTKLLPNPKSHLSQVIMALLFCAEMCE